MNQYIVKSEEETLEVYCDYVSWSENGLKCMVKNESSDTDQIVALFTVWSWFINNSKKTEGK